MGYMTRRERDLEVHKIKKQAEEVQQEMTKIAQDAEKRTKETMAGMILIMEDVTRQFKEIFGEDFIPKFAVSTADIEILARDGYSKLSVEEKDGMLEFSIKEDGV